MDEWVDVACVTSAKDRKGRLVVHGVASLSSLLCEGLDVAFVPPVVDAPRFSCIESLRFISDTSASIGLSTIDTPERARLLVGCHMLIRATVCAHDTKTPYTDMVGYRVFDATEGEIGLVKRLADNPGQFLLEVACLDGHTALVPFVEEIVVHIDDEACRIDLVAPRGLFDL